MGWLSEVAVLVLLSHISLSNSASQSLPLRENYLAENGAPSDVDDIATQMKNNLDSKDPEEDGKIQELTNYLTYVLLRPWPVTGLPLLYVEDYPAEAEYQDQEEDLSDIGGEFGADNQIIRQAPYKRTRYYRKYPWKRQNSRETYEAENRYLCQPSKDDVFRLLVALHEARQGNRGHTIHFCNRKRPASAIFTNIRFLGRRK